MCSEEGGRGKHVRELQGDAEEHTKRWIARRRKCA